MPMAVKFVGYIQEPFLHTLEDQVTVVVRYPVKLFASDGTYNNVIFCNVGDLEQTESQIINQIKSDSADQITIEWGQPVAASDIRLIPSI